jgi:hypothetical protein
MLKNQLLMRERWRPFYRDSKKLAIGLFFEFWTMSSGRGHCLVGEDIVRLTLSRKVDMFFWKFWFPYVTLEISLSFKHFDFIKIIMLHSSL